MAHYEVEQITNEVYKEALWMMHSNDPHSTLHTTKNQKRASSTLNEKFFSPLNTSLDGFRNFTIDPEWEHDIKKGYKTHMKYELDKQHTTAVQKLVDDRAFNE